ncbi:MAG: hypothetical protein ACHBN1_04015 [Heteroscytonema crispum UTEX LB 1556]
MKVNINQQDFHIERESVPLHNTVFLSAQYLSSQNKRSQAPVSNLSITSQ